MVMEMEMEMSKNIFMFVNSVYGKRCGGVFEMKIKIRKRGCDVELTEYPEGEELSAIASFYDHRPFAPPIDSVAACVLGSILYVLPDDMEPGLLYKGSAFKGKGSGGLNTKRPIIPMCTFDLKHRKKKVFPVLPHARKPGPILTTLVNRVFALSAFISPMFKVLEPCFESVDPNHGYIWTPSPCPPHHNKGLPPTTGLRVQGYAVLDKSFILVSYSQHHQQENQPRTVRFYTCNIDSTNNMWIEVPITNSTGHGHGIVPWIEGEAVVMGRDIYAFNCRMLYVFSYTNAMYTNVSSSSDAINFDLSVDFATKVEGFKLEKDTEVCDAHFMRSGTIAKVDDDIICVLHTLHPSVTDFDVQRFCVTFILLQNRDYCKIIKFFKCTLSVGLELHDPTIKSCFVLDPNEISDHRSRKRAVLLK